MGRTEETAHSFIQFLDGNNGQSHYLRYPLQEFQAAKDSFAVKIGSNNFAYRELRLDIENADIRLKGQLTFHNQVPWPSKWSSPGIMGWYSFIPFMECYHGVLSLDHTIEGILSVNGHSIDLTGGLGYMEKDWGKAFPRTWIWAQCNHFQNEATSFMGSIASIPWLISWFRGFIMGLWHDGRLYPFTTYNRSKVEKIKIGHNSVTFHISNHRTGYGLKVTAATNRTGKLRAPLKEDMISNVRESLTAEIQVELSKLGPGGEKIIFSGRGRHGGFEICGDTELLLA